MTAAEKHAMIREKVLQTQIDVLTGGLKLIANTQYRTNKAGKVDPIEIDHCIRIAKSTIRKAKRYAGN